MQRITRYAGYQFFTPVLPLELFLVCDGLLLLLLYTAKSIPFDFITCIQYVRKYALVNSYLPVTEHNVPCYSTVTRAAVIRVILEMDEEGVIRQLPADTTIKS